MTSSLASSNAFNEFKFNFHRFNIDKLFSIDDQNKMLNWIDKARRLLIDILRNEHVQVLYMWFNIYNDIYDRLTSSMTISKCLELLRASPSNDQHRHACTILNDLISSFEISIPHPTSLISPLNSQYRVPGLAEKVFDFTQDYATAKLDNDIPTIFMNHQTFDVMRNKENDMDVISESTGIFFIAIALAHEITHAINLCRSIHNHHIIKKYTPELMVFRSYSHAGHVDAGNLVERILLDGEIHLSKPPPIPPVLFIIVSSDGKQIPVPNEVIEECIQKRSLVTITKHINLSQKSARHANFTQSPSKLAPFQPLLTFQTLSLEFVETSSPTIPILKSMMHVK